MQQDYEQDRDWNADYWRDRPADLRDDRSRGYDRGRSSMQGRYGRNDDDYGRDQTGAGMYSGRDGGYGGSAYERGYGYGGGYDRGRDRDRYSQSGYGSGRAVPQRYASAPSSGYGGSGQYGRSGRADRYDRYGDDYGRSGQYSASGSGYGSRYGNSGDMDTLPVWTYTEVWLIPGEHTGKGPQGYQRSDDRIREDACERLTQHGQLDASRITVQAQNGEITLTGTVDSRDAKRMAEDAVEGIPGVRDVHNQLRTSTSQSQGGQSGQANGQTQQQPSGMSSQTGQQAQQTQARTQGDKGMQGAQQQPTQQGRQGQTKQGQQDQQQQDQHKQKTSSNLR